jgi:hypothetical protein
MERQALRRFSAPCRPDAIPAGKPVRRSEPSLCTWSLYSPLNRREGGPADYLDAYQEALVKFCELRESRTSSLPKTSPGRRSGDSFLPRFGERIADAWTVSGSRRDVFVHSS